MLKVDDALLLDRMLSMPGAVSVIFLLSVLLPALGVFPGSVTLAMFVAFSVPTLYIFMAQGVLNRDISLKRHVIVSWTVSYLFFLSMSWPLEPLAFYIQSFYFTFGSLFAFLVYLVYFGFFRLGKSRESQLSHRKRLLLCFLPTLMITLTFSVVVGYFSGGWMFRFEEML